MKILLCTDGSADAARAVRFGLQLAQRHTDSLRLLGVVEDQENAERLIRSALEALGTELQTSGLAYETKMRHGHAAEQILDEAAAWQADLIVMGQLGRRGFTRFIMGGTATRIIQYARCSVLLVKGQRSALRNMLVCTAGGRPGLRDVETAGQLAAQAKAAVTVLHVMSQVALSEKTYQPELEAAAAELIARQTREGLHLEAALNQLTSWGVSCAAKVRHGFVVDEIVAEVKDGDYDLLIIGANLARGLTRWLLDDVMAHVLERTQVPILVVRDARQ
ncbi:Universal stress protein/MSMEI_3859 [Thermoflexales bacterium]|nr:Universal stress protein/MSMEI_3859 [Thermoflexales bacterium]